MHSSLGTDEGPPVNNSVSSATRLTYWFTEGTTHMNDMLALIKDQRKPLILLGAMLAFSLILLGFKGDGLPPCTLDGVEAMWERVEQLKAEGRDRDGMVLAVEWDAKCGPIDALVDRELGIGN